MPLEGYFQPPILYIWLAPLILWTLLWKALALWKAGRNKQPGWFITLFLMQTIGVLDLVYILFFQRQR